MSNAQSCIATRKVKWDRNYQAKHGINTGKAHDLSDAQREQLGRLAKRTYRALYMSGQLGLAYMPEWRMFER